MTSQPTVPSLGDIVHRGSGKTEYRIWCIDGEIAFATSQNTGIPHRVPLDSLRFVRTVPDDRFGPAH